MAYFLQQLVTGLAVGGTYALVALGFVLYFGVLNILNIAHAQTLMLAPVLIVVLMRAGTAWPIAVAAAIVLTFVYSYAVYMVAMKPFTRPGREASYLAPFVASFGVSMLTENLASTWLGSQPLSFPLRLPVDVWHVGPVAVVPIQAVGLLICCVLMLALGWVVARTGFGRAMRAVAENRAVAEAQGISADRTTVITVVIATFLGVVAGLLFAAGTTSVSPFVGLEYGLKGLVVMIIGGVTSLAGAVVAGLLVGLLETGITAYVSSTYQDTITFGLLFLILLVRPQGLFTILSREGRP
jgi:branched-chain amino acid transport system permease protein